MNYSDFVVAKRSGRIYKLESPWDNSKKFNLIKSKDNLLYNIYTSLFIRIPFEFKAYIKRDSAFHGLDGQTIDLKLNVEDADLDFRNVNPDDKCLWFFGKGVDIPNGDIDFSTLSIEDPIPPLPTLEELQHCTIEYSGRKTIITYCDAFVGEAICHKDDEFKAESGIALAYSRAKEAKDEYDAKHREIVVGDTVKVVSAGSNFSTDTPWLYDNIQNFSLAKKYAFGDFLMYSPDRFDNFTVLYIGQDKIAYIQNCKNEICRIIPIKALTLA